METIALNKDFAEKVGEFIDAYVDYGDAPHVPRNVPIFKESFRVMIESGLFRNASDIRKQCLKECHIILPNYLLE